MIFFRQRAYFCRENHGDALSEQRYKCCHWDSTFKEV